MKTVLAWIGGLTLALAALGAMGIGSFAMVYGPDKIDCVKVSK
jgi:hypothetical protein